MIYEAPKSQKESENTEAMSQYSTSVLSIVIAIIILISRF